MTASRFIEILEKSGNSLLGAAGEDIADWSKLAHNKECLELFLSYNIAVVNIERKGEFLVSSNPRYLSYLDGQRVVRNKNKVVRIISRSPEYSKFLKSRNQGIVRTWNLIENEKLEIPMDRNWSIMRWIGINTRNVAPLAVATTEILERGKAVRREHRA